MAKNCFDTLGVAWDPLCVLSHRRIHIGMDEAHSLGRGAYLYKHGYEPTSPS